MKTRTIATLIPFIAAGLFIAAPSQAQQPIPGIKQTGQWRDLNAYVDQLQAKRSTPATAEQKANFRSRLNAKQSAANSRVKKLYSQRLQQIINRDQAQEQRRIQKLLDASNRRVGQLQGQRSSRIATAKANFANQLDRIRSRYAASLAADSRQLETLRRNLARTTNPFQRQIILQHIETVQNDISQLRSAQSKEISSATDDHRQKIASIRQRFAARIKSTRSYYQGLIDQVQDAWKKIYDDDVRAVKAQRDNEFQLVTTLRNRGAGYIDQMPTPVT